MGRWQRALMAMAAGRAAPAVAAVAMPRIVGGMGATATAVTTHAQATVAVGLPHRGRSLLEAKEGQRRRVVRHGFEAGGLQVAAEVTAAPKRGETRGVGVAGTSRIPSSNPAIQLRCHRSRCRDTAR